MIYLLTLITAFFWLFILKKLKPSKKTLEIEIVKSFLPQTGCTDCGYDSCAPYAESLLQGEKINLCTMGGDRTFNLMRDFFASPEKIGEKNASDKVKIIDEKCIGCTRCIKACPVDAIIGAPKLMHSVIEEICNGCRLCLDVCPTDCIEIIEKTIPSKPKSFLNCIRCARCNSPQNPNMEKLYYLVEAGDGANLARFNFSLNENKDALNSVCPVSIPLFDYLSYGLYLAEDSKKQEDFAKKNLEHQNQKLARQLKEAQAKKQLAKAKQANIIASVNIYTPPTNFTDKKTKQKKAEKPVALKETSVKNLTSKDSPVDVQAKLMALKVKMKNKDSNNFDHLDKAMQKQKPNFVIAKKVAIDNLNYATKVLYNLKKSSNIKAERIKEQKKLIKEAQEQLEAIEKELMLEQN